jgi:hypothetical protein
MNSNVKIVLIVFITAPVLHREIKKKSKSMGCKCIPFHLPTGSLATALR